MTEVTLLLLLFHQSILGSHITNLRDIRDCSVHKVVPVKPLVNGDLHTLL